MRRYPAGKTVRNLATVLLLMLAGTALALPPPRPGLVDPLTGRFRTTGQMVPVFPKEVRTHRPSAMRGKVPLDPKRAPSRAGVRPLAVDAKTQPLVRPLVLLIDFNDRPASATPSIADPAALDNLFFGNGASDLSVRNYWNEVSYGQFTIQPPSAVSSNPNVVGWLRPGVDFPSSITQSSQIAGVQPGNVRTLLDDAITYLRTQNFNFSPYTRGTDNSLNAVIIVQPGYGAEDSGDPASDTYSHSAPIPPIATPAGNISDYVIVPAVQFYDDPTPGTDPSDDQRIGAGVIVHEMGHLLGLPDLYPTQPFGVATDNAFSGAGVYELMAYGMWGSDLLLRADTPSHLSAWPKSFLGWLTPTLVDATSSRTLRPVEIFRDVDKIYSNSAADPTQYFLVENRELSSTLGSWLFDRFLPGAGALIWQIDEYVIATYPENVNGNPQFRGVYVKEADGRYHLAQPVTGASANDRAIYYGVLADYFSTPAQLFDRTNPSSTVNSSPIVDNSYTNHPRDFKRQVALSGFTRTSNNSVEYLAGIPRWKTYSRLNTGSIPGGPMPGNDILSVGFDSGNNTWMGSSDRGIFRFLGASFQILDSTEGLPEASPPASFPLSPIRAMTFESATGSMWVGTDRGLYKMRDSGGGFRVTDTSHVGGLGIPGNRVPPPPFDNGANVIRALAIRGGFQTGSQKIDIKYAATPVGLLRVDDQNNDPALDDAVSIILRGDVTSVAVDDNGTPTALDDVVWVGFANGTFTRSLLPGEGGNAQNDPLADANFRTPRYELSGFPKITALAVDNKGILWIGTDTLGLQAFDLGETQNPQAPNLRDPYDFNGDGNLEEEPPPTYPPARNVYLNVSLGMASNHVTGIAFQAFAPSSTRTGAVAWISGLPVPPSTLGGVTRFDGNDNVVDRRIAVFRPEAGVLPQDQVNGPASMYMSSAVADRAGNVWFGTTVSDPQGVSKFGDAGIPSLDRNNYLNTTATAVVTLQNDGLNLSPDVEDTANVRVTSDSDATGFLLTLKETGVNTGVFQGVFGFTNGPTAGAASLISVQRGNKVFVDTVPKGLVTAEAFWSSEFPFDDGLIIKPWCFVATAAYGSVMAPEVRAFRAFRDDVLLQVPGGEALVGLYYRLSPPLAGWISERRERRYFARFVLVPPAMLANWAAGAAPGEKAATVLLVVASSMLLLLRRRGGRGDGPGRPGRG